MKPLQFPEPFEHRHPPIRELDALLAERQSLSQKAADLAAVTVGSWRFLLIQSLLLAVWFIINTTGWFHHWDPYPFIFMNLVLSLQAAYTASVVMISENRQNERDRLQARADFEVNKKAEEEVRAILEHLACQNQALLTIHQQILELQKKFEAAPQGRQALSGN